MTRKKQQYNNGFNRNSHSPLNNGLYNNGSCNRGQYNNGALNNTRAFNHGPYNNGALNSVSFNNDLLNNGSLNNGPRNNGSCNRSPHNTNFYNRVAHSNPPRNVNPHNNHSYHNHRPNNNNKPQGAITQRNSNGDKQQPNGRLYINNTVVTHPSPGIQTPKTPEPKNQASGKTTEDRTRLLRLICEYYSINNIEGILKDPGHAPAEWDNLLLNKIYWLRNHEVDLQEIREGLGRHIAHRVRKGTKRSDRPVKPYVLPQDVEALIKDVENARKEQSESEVSIPNSINHKSKTTPTSAPKKRASSGTFMSEEPSSIKRRRRVYASPDSSTDTDVYSSCSVVYQVSDKHTQLSEQLCNLADKMRQAVARVQDTKIEFEKALAALEKEGKRFNRIANQTV
ncbi:hypothetical protein CI238_04355 [Colletotrichum incanum]|uniref:Uncharacterized protein n=1 Tax=Colletotrichum incanum TaxID=1573173 RepID=A0A161YMN2_COLIC|nr:hypothetical protein CI238_04355 [Colletotrichum incanum]